MIHINVIRGMEDELKRQRRRAYLHRYRQSHSKQLRIYANRWRQENLEKCRVTDRAKSKRWYHKNKVECWKRSAAWKQEHPESTKRTHRKSYKKFRQENVERSRRYASQHRSEAVARMREWAKANPEQHRANKKLGRQKRRGRRLKAQGSHTLTQWLARVTFYGSRCFYCHVKLSSRTLTKDHRIPLVRGGSEWPSNLVPACHSCNSRKHTKTPLEFMAVV